MKIGVLAIRAILPNIFVMLKRLGVETAKYACLCILPGWMA